MPLGHAGSERGALALVLHTHMPYVEGFGTWPFGEEWLWEAIACCYLPLLDLLDRGAPVTVSLTPVLCDQLELADLPGRFERFITDVRRVTHARDAAGLREGGHGALADEVERAWESDYAAALGALHRRGGTLLESFRPYAQWTSAATHAVLPLLASDSGVRLQVRSGIASHRRRFGERWRGGFWLPECAYAPWLERVLEEEGVRRVCVELTAQLGLGSDENLRVREGESGVLFAAIDRATISLVWSEGGYPSAGPYRDYHHHTVHQHKPWSNAGEPYDHARALALARTHAEDFVGRVRRRLAAASADAGGAPLVVCALDTELLGHWWYEGMAWLEAVVDESARQGLELVRLDDALDAIEPLPLPSPAPAVSSWGSGGDLSTWSGPPVADIAFQTRAGELAVLRARGAAGDDVLRELLALQASDWAFMISRGTAEPYARERFEGHRRALAAALAGGSSPPAPGNLAIDSCAFGAMDL